MSGTKCVVRWCIAERVDGDPRCAVHQKHGGEKGPWAETRRRPWAEREPFRTAPVTDWPWVDRPHWTEAY